MKVMTKAHSVEAFCFRGTKESAEAAREWLSSLDILDTELTYQGEAEPLGLDLITDQGLRTLEKGEWLICHNGRMRAESAAEFAEGYEAI